MSVVEQGQMVRRSLFKKKGIGKVVLWVTLGLLCIAGMGSWILYQVKRIEGKQTKKFAKLAARFPALSERLGGLAIPVRLAGIPFGEEIGLVQDVISIDIRNVHAPYNPTILKTSNGYDLFFRYDIFSSKLKHASYSSNIGVVSLDRQFQQSKEFKRIDLKTPSSEDPRIVSVKDQLYLFYNRMDDNHPHPRFMCVANLKPDTYEVLHNTTFDMNLQWIEKNWSPFEYIGPDQQPHLLVEYRINPRKLIELPNPQANEITNMPVPASLAYLDLAWTRKWGEIRGGTPSILIGDEYLGFFHSWFEDDYEYAWYVMGAYTFAATPPFQVTGISPHPILFKKIYQTPMMNTASFSKRVIFPSGFVIEKDGDREMIYLACGENDAGVKIVVIDKETLIQNLMRF